MGIGWVASVVVAIVLVGGNGWRAIAASIAKEVVLGFAIVGNAPRA